MSVTGSRDKRFAARLGLAPSHRQHPRRRPAAPILGLVPIVHDRRLAMRDDGSRGRMKADGPRQIGSRTTR
jgi:hypothetical protein